MVLLGVKQDKYLKTKPPLFMFQIKKIVTNLLDRYISCTHCQAVI